MIAFHYKSLHLSTIIIAIKRKSFYLNANISFAVERRDANHLHA